MKNIQNHNWDMLYANGRDFMVIDTASVSKLVELVDNDMDNVFLDIGCGTGQLVRDMYHRGFSCFGIDSSVEAIKVAKQSTKYLDKGIEFYVGDALDLPDKKFNLITCKHVIAFLNDRTKFYDVVKNRMQVKSTFVVITPDIDKLPPEKQSIAIPDEILTKELTTHFTNVEKNIIKNDFWYICKI